MNLNYDYSKSKEMVTSLEHPEFVKESPYQDIASVTRIVQMETAVEPTFRTWRQEIKRNYMKVAGELYSKADLQKIANEQRPDFIYNYLVPFILKLGGAFKGGAKKLEARPTTIGDDDIAAIATKVLDWVHYDANDLENEHAKAFIDAIIGRIGWLATEWSFENDPLGQAIITRYDNERLKFDINFTKRDTSDMNWILDGNWMTPEEIMMKYALEDENMWEEINYWSKAYIGEDTIKEKRLATFADRVLGFAKQYIGLKSGFDAADYERTGMEHTGQYFNSQEGLFKVLELHERRTELRWYIKQKKPSFNPITGQPTFKEFDITDAINASLDGSSYDHNALQAVKAKYVNDNGGQYDIEKKISRQVYQTTIIPSMNMKVYDAPYPVQNGMFKFVPVFCFDFNINPLLARSYVDLMADPVSSYNLRRNTNLTILLKSAKGGWLYEEGALVEGKEDDFHDNTVGANKEVARGAISGGKIKEMPSVQIPVAEERYAQEDKASMREMSGLTNNATGLKESANESGKAIAQRTENADEMQYWVQENGLGQLVNQGKNTLAYISHYMNMKRVFQVANEEDNPYWLTINEAAIDELTGDYYIKNDMSKVGNMRLTLSPVPFGDREKRQEFEETMIIAEKLAALNPQFVNPQILIKAGTIKNKREWLAYLDMIMGQVQDATQRQMLMEAIEQQKSNIQFDNEMQMNKLNMEGQKMGLNQQKNQVDFDNLIRQASGF